MEFTYKNHKSENAYIWSLIYQKCIDCDWRHSQIQVAPFAYRGRLYSQIEGRQLDKWKDGLVWLYPFGIEAKFSDLPPLRRLEG